MIRVKRSIFIILGSIVTSGVSFAQDAPKPLTNADVIQLAKSGLSESAIVATIRSNPANFDLSPDGLIKLHAGKVTENEMQAMMAAARGTPPAASAAPAATAAPVTPAAASSSKKSRVPTITISQNGTELKLPLEKTQLAQTKNKPTSMGKMATDTAMLQGMQASMSSATSDVASHMGSIGGSTLGAVGGAFSSVLGQRKPEVTYVWGIAGPASRTVLTTDSPQVSLNFSTVPGINPDEFEPALVKLTPAQNAFRLVGASRGKEDALSSSATNWEVYSGFVEDRVKIQSQKLGPGQFQISPVTPLLPGEYGVVLRPVSKDKKFSGGDVARAQGDGLMFDAVWSFQVSTDEE
jgi:hypothetical protein